MRHMSARATSPSSSSSPLLSRARAGLAAAGLATLALLGGCASFNAVDSEVSAYGDWPAGRAPGTYVFDRLPSQSARPDRQFRLEQAAAAALAQAGFRPAEGGQPADVTVQVGARIDVTEISPWADPLWWHGPVGPYYRPWWGPGPRPWWGPGPWVGPGPWWGPGMGPMDYDTRYSRQVALLIRDRATGKPLYEAHAETTGSSAGSDRLVAAMFLGAMAEFPRAEGQPHTVRTMLPPVAPPANAVPALPAPASSPAPEAH